MTGPQDQDAMPKPRRRGRIAATVALLLLLLVAGGFLVGLWMLGAAMGFGDACSFTPESLHCPNGEIGFPTYWTFLALLPGGLLAGLVLGSVGGGISIHRGRTGLAWAGAAWGVFALAFVLATVVGGYVMW
ncbi:hypothetical protein [Saccharopolyspora rosea]|uniref:Integral membrane protein n=1 Tax=Saccharopolyspora rosea TaxID=524884 RepID=A0ABW3FLM2_9PSEU|nr:hypothetical protein [Saccharopolyspora rosea]